MKKKAPKEAMQIDVPLKQSGSLPLEIALKFMSEEEQDMLRNYILKCLIAEANDARLAANENGKQTAM